MKLPYKLDSMELRNCNIGCRSACMYVLFYFFCSFSCFPDGFAVRNWSSRHPHESRQELPAGKNSCRPTDRRSHFSWPRAPVGEAVRNPIPDGISGIPDGFWLSGVSRFLVVVAVWTPRSAPAAARRRPGCLLGMVTLAVCFLILVTEHGSEQVLCDIITLAWSQGVEIYPWTVTSTLHGLLYRATREKVQSRCIVCRTGLWIEDELQS